MITYLCFNLIQKLGTHYLVFHPHFFGTWAPVRQIGVYHHEGHIQVTGLNRLYMTSTIVQLVGSRWRKAGSSNIVITVNTCGFCAHVLGIELGCWNKKIQSMHIWYFFIVIVSLQWIHGIYPYHSGMLYLPWYCRTLPRSIWVKYTVMKPQQQHSRAQFLRYSTRRI